MSFKRILSLILVLLLVLGMCASLFGCAKKGGYEGSAEGGQQVEMPGGSNGGESSGEASSGGAEASGNGSEGSLSGGNDSPVGTGEAGSDELPAVKPTEGKTIEELIGDINKDKQKVNAYLIMGIDKHGEVSPNEGRTDGGQCDAIYLLLVNDKARDYSILQLNRDTITDVPVLGYQGEIVYYRQYPLALAHGYGSGGKDSCENAVLAVSKMLGDVRIDGYIAMNFEGIVEVNDTVGGVDVLMADDMTVVNPAFVKGETVHLDGLDTLSFIRTREGVTDDLNTKRMSRQRTYLGALMAKYKAEIKANSSILNVAYKRVEPFVLSNLSMAEITNIASKCAGYSGGKIETTKGSGQWTQHEQSGKEFFYFYLDQDALKEQVQRLFY